MRKEMMKRVKAVISVLQWTYSGKSDDFSFSLF